MAQYRPLKESEIRELENRNCRAAAWGRVLVAEPFDAARVRNVVFLGDVRLGSLGGTVKCGSIDQLCGVYDAVLADTTIGDGCLVRGVRSRLAGYDIGDGAVVEDVGVVESTPGAAFGCGTVVDALNEGGGRGVALYPELSAQVAYVLSLHRYRPQFIQKIQGLIAARAAKAKAGRATIGAHAQVRGVQTIRNVAIGPAATVWGAAELENGTILSEPQAPTLIGSAVVAHDFVVAEGAAVTDGALLAHCYVGQGCRIGKQFSAEHCLFFANCEAFHGEGCAAFGGPYTVTHHKSTLLIAALFSFFNAGSGTNQSNHMYKLGPLHQGILERGCKTGSFSYLLWPCRVGPFSVVIGKNMANFDLGDLPFSYVEAQGNKSYVTPGYNLYTVGTVRDGAKWLARDRRKASVKRDLVNAAVFSPYVVGRLLRGEKLLGKLATETDRAVDEVNINGALVRRLILKSGVKFYALAIESYLTQKLVARAEPAAAQGLDAVRKRLAPELDGAKDREWYDVCGMLVARDRFAAFVADVESGAVADLEALQARLAACHAAYERDEWNWVASVWEERFHVKPHEMSGAALGEAADRLLICRTKTTKMIVADAEREFSQTAQIGFGADGGPDARTADFESVRGTYAGNKFVVEMNAELAALAKRVSDFKAKVAAMA